jgi:hypothetical protein
MSLPVTSVYSVFFQGLFDDQAMISIPTGFQSFFGNPQGFSQTWFIEDNELFEYEIIRGDKTIAGMVPRGIEGVITDVDEDTSQQWTGVRRFFPLVQGVDSINVKKISNRLPGEMPYMMAGQARPMTKTERLRELARREHRNRIRRMMHTHEYLASLSVLEGKMPAILDDPTDDQIYDFYRNAGNIIDVDTEWNDSGITFIDIMADIDEGVDAGVQNGKAMIDMGIIGREILPIWLSKTGYEKYFDIRRSDLGTIAPATARESLPERFRRFVGPGGLEPLGRLTTPKNRDLWIFAYNQYYERPAGTINYYMPEDEMVFGSSGARSDRYFGPGDVLPPTSFDERWYQERFGFTSMDVPMPEQTPPGDVFDSRMFHFYAYEATNKKTISLVTESAPVFVTTQTDAYVTLKGLYVAP